MVSLNRASFGGRTVFRAALACVFTPCLNSAAMAQGASCSAASSNAWRQSAMSTLPTQTPAQQTSPALWGVNDIPPLITPEQAAADQQNAAQQAAEATRAALAAAAPTLVMPQSGGQLSGAGAGGSNAGNLGSSGSIGGVANGSPTFSDNFSGGIDPDKWGVNYPWGKIQGDPTQYAAYTDSLNSDVFSTGPNGLNIAIKPTGVDGKPAETGQIHSKQAFQYGYVEMTATLPTTKGVGGAFWMMPTDGSGTYTEPRLCPSWLG